MNYKPYQQDFKCDLKSGALSFLDLDKEQQPFEKASKSSGHPDNNELQYVGLSNKRLGRFYSIVL